jgi:hypothetical protein
MEAIYFFETTVDFHRNTQSWIPDNEHFYIV